MGRLCIKKIPQGINPCGIIFFMFSKSVTCCQQTSGRYFYNNRGNNDNGKNGRNCLSHLVTSPVAFFDAVVSVDSVVSVVTVVVEIHAKDNQLVNRIFI